MASKSEAQSVHKSYTEEYSNKYWTWKNTVFHHFKGSHVEELDFRKQTRSQCVKDRRIQSLF